MSNYMTENPQSSTPFKYKCCKTKSFTHYVCIQCFSIYHKCCIPRFKHAIKIVGGHQIICCKTETDQRSEEQQYLNVADKSILETTIKELTEENELKDNYIRKLKKDKELFVADASLCEEEMYGKIRAYEQQLQELKSNIKQIKMPTKPYNNSETKTTGTQTIDIATETIPVDTDPVSFIKTNTDFSKINVETQTTLVVQNMSTQTNTGKIVGDAESETFHDNQINPVKNTKEKNKILIISDDNGLKCAEILHSCIKNDIYNISSIFKPNALFENVVENCDKLATKFNKNDYVVILAGINNAFRHQVISTLKLKQLFTSLRHTNIIIVGIAYAKNQNFLNNFIYKLNNIMFTTAQTFKHINYIDVNNTLYYANYVNNNSLLLSYNAKRILLKKLSKYFDCVSIHKHLINIKTSDSYPLSSNYQTNVFNKDNEPNATSVKSNKKLISDISVLEETNVNSSFFRA